MTNSTCKKNIVRFHLIPQFDLENCIESKIVPNPHLSSGTDTQARAETESMTERLGMEKGEEQK